MERNGNERVCKWPTHRKCCDSVNKSLNKRRVEIKLPLNEIYSRFKWKEKKMKRKVNRIKCLQPYPSPFQQLHQIVFNVQNGEKV